MAFYWVPVLFNKWTWFLPSAWLICFSISQSFLKHLQLTWLLLVHFILYFIFIENTFLFILYFIIFYVPACSINRTLWLQCREWWGYPQGYSSTLFNLIIYRRKSCGQVKSWDSLLSLQGQQWGRSSSENKQAGLFPAASCHRQQGAVAAGAHRAHRVPAGAAGCQEPGQPWPALRAALHSCSPAQLQHQCLAGSTGGVPMGCLCSFIPVVRWNLGKRRDSFSSPQSSPCSAPSISLVEMPAWSSGDKNVTFAPWGKSWFFSLAVKSVFCRKM